MSTVKALNWNLILLAYVSLFCSGLLDNSRGPIYPELLRHFQLNGNLGSLFFSVASVASLGVNLSARFWLRALPALWWVRVSHGFFLLGALGIGLMIVLGKYYFLVVASCFVLGMGMSINGIMQNVLIAQGSPVELRRRALAGLHSTYGVASLLAPMLLNLWVYGGGSWKWFFVVLGVVPLGCLVLSFVWAPKVKEPPPVREVLKAPVLWRKRLLYGGLFGFYVAGELLISSRLVYYLQGELGFSMGKSNSYLGFFFLWLLAGRLFFAFVPMGRRSQTYLLWSLLLTLFSFGVGYAVHPLGLVFCGLTMSWFFPCAMGMLGEHFPRDLDYMTASVLTAVGILLIGMHALFGWVSDGWGLRTAFLLAGVVEVVSLGFLIVIGRGVKGRA